MPRGEAADELTTGQVVQATVTVTVYNGPTRIVRFVAFGLLVANVVATVQSLGLIAPVLADGFLAACGFAVNQRTRIAGTA